MTLSDLIGRVNSRLDDANGAGFYSNQEIINALNWAQRLFVMRTLCLEKSVNLTLPTGQFFHIRVLLADWFLPLRIRYSNRLITSTPNGPTFGNLATPVSAPKLRTRRIWQLTALNANWIGSVGLPTYYGHLGGDVLFFDTQIGTPSPEFLITYACAPSNMTLVSDSPSIPDVDQPSLIDGALPILRMKEGGQEFQKSKEYWKRFLATADTRAVQVRARNLAAQYDYLPPELARFDESKSPPKANPK